MGLAVPAAVATIPTPRRAQPEMAAAVVALFGSTSE